MTVPSEHQLLYLLHDEQVIGSTALQLALYEQQLNQTSGLDYLIIRQHLDVLRWTHFAEQYWLMSAVDLSTIKTLDPTVHKLPKDAFIKHQLLPLYIQGNTLYIATAFPHHTHLFTALSESLNAQWLIAPLLADYAGLQKHLSLYLAPPINIDQLLMRISQAPEALSVPRPESEHLVVQLLEQIILNAAQRHSSDIHFDPNEHHTLVRWRMDGVLNNACQLHPHLWQAVLIRIKVLAYLDISQNRLPQEGRFTSFNNIDIRVSTLPSLQGEHVVLRLLNHLPCQTINDLGFDESQLKALKTMIKHPSGLILIAGPTGSGKSTTLYALIREFDAQRLNIITLEDPIEQRLDYIRQIQINAQRQFDFFTALKQTLRQDPDIILVGEIRDAKTADLTIKAAMTGHLVFATIHADSVSAMFERLHDLAIPRTVLARLLRGAIAQRLVRKRCNHCGGEGCENCLEQGYLGRLALIEYFINPSDQTQLILSDTFKPLSVAANRLIELGMTDAKEIDRVLGTAIH